jgi:hypothetical protein
MQMISYISTISNRKGGCKVTPISVKNTLIVQGRLIRAGRTAQITKAEWLEIYRANSEGIEQLDEGTQKTVIVDMAKEFSAAEKPTSASA